MDSAPLLQALLLILHLVLTMVVRAQATMKSPAGAAISFQSPVLLSNPFLISLLGTFMVVVWARMVLPHAGDVHKAQKQSLGNANRFREPSMSLDLEQGILVP